MGCTHPSKRSNDGLNRNKWHQPEYSISSVTQAPSCRKIGDDRIEQGKAGHGHPQLALGGGFQRAFVL